MDEDYTTAGFDKFMSRGDTPNQGGSLDNEDILNNAIPFDRNQLTGKQSDSYRVGNVSIDGASNSILVKDDKNTRIIIGEQGDGTQGITVSKEGKDANINRPQDLVLNSSQNVFKIVKKATAIIPEHTVVGVAGQFLNFISQVNYPHGLSYTPQVIAYLDKGGALYPLPRTTPVGFGTTAWWETTYLNSGSTNITLTHSVTTYDAILSQVFPASNIILYILQETAN